MQTERNTPKSAPSSLRRVGKVGLSLINPLSDVGYLYRHGVQPVMNNLRRIRETLRARSRVEKGSPVSWAEAVEQSGKSVAELTRNYRIIRLIWWLLMILAGGFALILVLLLVFAGFSISMFTLIHAFVTALVLATAGMLGAVKTAEATWHLWQLSVQRVSEAERGTFRDFWAEAKGYKSILRPMYRYR